jgi:hypothetical protein
MCLTKKEIRNIDVMDMEIDVREIISSKDKESKEFLDEIDSIHKRYLKSIQCTGEPDRKSLYTNQLLSFNYIINTTYN